MKNLSFIIFLNLFCYSAFSEDIPSKDELQSDQVIGNIDGKKNAYIPNTNVLPHFDVDKNLKNKMDEAKEILDKSKNIGSSEKDGVFAQNQQNEQLNSELVGVEPPVEMSRKRPNKVRNQGHSKSEMVQIPQPVSFKDSREGVRFFPQNFHYVQEVTGVETISLPSGSTAMATVLAGVEVSASETRKTYATINYAFLGPNQTVVELKDCIIWMSVNGNYTTERIYGDVSTLSCRAPNGKTFTVAIKGHMIDRKDQYIGAKGELLTRGKILGAALMFLRDATSEFGKAMSAAQITTNLAEGNQNVGPKSSENVTGSQTKYIIGKSSQAAVATFMNWWVDFYMNLSPTIAIGPGAKIFLAIEEEVQIPKIFFQTSFSQNEVENEQKRLNTVGGLDENSKKKDS